MITTVDVILSQIVQTSTVDTTKGILLSNIRMKITSRNQDDKRGDVIEGCIPSAMFHNIRNTWTVDSFGDQLIYDLYFGNNPNIP